MTEEEKRIKKKETNRKFLEAHPDYYKNYRDKHKNSFAEYNKKWYNKKYKPVVYKYTEISTNICAYIGSTVNLSMRINTRNYGEQNSEFTFAKIYNKNRDNFVLEILGEFETIEEARDYERLLIKKYQPKYNILLK